MLDMFMNIYDTATIGRSLVIIAAVHCHPFAVAIVSLKTQCMGQGLELCSLVAPVGA